MTFNPNWRASAERELILRREVKRREDRTEYEDSLYLFLRAAWKYIDSAKWQDGWPIEAVAEHLQAVVDGDIRRLIINIPPRMGKSSMCSVAFPAWCWAQRFSSPTSGPEVSFLHASYGYSLSERDSARCLRLLSSHWYQSYWGDRFSITKNAVARIQNDKNGERLITSIGGRATGEGGDIIVIDDPNAANEVESEATIEGTIEWWSGTMSTRLNDQKTGAYVIIQQRLAEEDLTGHIISKSTGDWTHLVLPMKYEPERSFSTLIGWKDPREEPGSLLWPERFGESEVRYLESELGPFRAAGQLQQRPEPAGGGVIKREWWQLWEDGAFPPMDYILATLDTAYTEKEINDPSAMTIWGVFSTDVKAHAARVIGPDGRPIYTDRAYDEGPPKVMLMYAWTARLELHELVEKVAATCRRLKIDKLIIENKASGIPVAQEMRRLYGHEDWGVQLYDPKSQDKLSRLYSVQHLFAEGMIYAPDMSWADMTITQIGTFPKGKHDDLVDTASMALRHLRDLGMLVRGPERLSEIEAMKVYRGRPEGPLYPG